MMMGFPQGAISGGGIAPHVADNQVIFSNPATQVIILPTSKKPPSHGVAF